MQAIVNSKGQITIPIGIRNRAKIVPGSKLDFQVEEDGTLKVSLLKQGITRLKGMVKSKRLRNVSLREMRQAVHYS